MDENNKLEFGNYKLRKFDLKNLYKPYLSHLEDIKSRLEELGHKYDFHGTIKFRKSWKTPFAKIKRLIRNTYNVYDKNYILGL